MASLRRKLEKYKSREWASSSDEVLLEEIRTYKVDPCVDLTTEMCVCVCVCVCVCAGKAELPVLQLQEEGHSTHKVFPCLLLRVYQESLRLSPPQVPKVWSCVWS